MKSRRLLLTVTRLVYRGPGIGYAILVSSLVVSRLQVVFERAGDPQQADADHLPDPCKFTAAKSGSLPTPRSTHSAPVNENVGVRRSTVVANLCAAGGFWSRVRQRYSLSSLCVGTPIFHAHENRLIAFSGSAIRYRKVRCEADFVKVLRYVVLLLLVGLSTAAPTCAETSIYFRGRPLFVPASIVLLVVGIALVAVGGWLRNLRRT